MLRDRDLDSIFCLLAKVGTSFREMILAPKDLESNRI